MPAIEEVGKRADEKCREGNSSCTVRLQANWVVCCVWKQVGLGFVAGRDNEEGHRELKSSQNFVAFLSQLFGLSSLSPTFRLPGVDFREVGVAATDEL
jgi:hypothetical protein